MSDTDRPGAGYLFVGTHGHVLALRKADGAVVWDTSLPRTGYDVVSILFEDGVLYCGAGGRVFGLDPVSGRILWDNGLPGMGTGLVFLSTAESNDSERVMSLFAQALADQRRRNSSGTAGAD